LRHLQEVFEEIIEAQTEDVLKVEQLLCSGGLPQQLVQQWQLAHMEPGVGLREAFRLGQQLQRACAKYEGEPARLTGWPRVAPGCNRRLLRFHACCCCRAPPAASLHAA
jgi:hypothetical protein